MYQNSICLQLLMRMLQFQAFLTFSQHTIIHKSILKYQNQIELFTHSSQLEKICTITKKRIVAIETLNAIVYMAQAKEKCLGSGGDC